MPELPEVTTTSKKLNLILPNQKIVDVWTNYKSKYFFGKENIKDPKYFKQFRKKIVGQKVKKVWRIGKNVLIDISGPKTILVHMKMTGHLLYGKYIYIKKENLWLTTEEGPLKDKFNQYIRMVFKLSNGKCLVLSDVRKFAKVALIDDGNVVNHKDIKVLGPDPLSKDFDFKKFKQAITKKTNKNIKSVLLDQNIISGIGNIYSDESLWLSGIHPKSIVAKIDDMRLKILLKNLKKILKMGIDFGGDSTSDYRQPDGRPGKFHHKHQAYKRGGCVCRMKNCKGTIQRTVVANRGTYFCDKHQKIFQ